MLEKILFEIPANLKADVLAGNVERFGTILKHVESGKIIGHLQETQTLSKLMSSAVDPINLLTNPISAVSSVAANFQLKKLTEMVEMLQTLGMANLGVSMVGVGMSAAGFVVIRKQLNDLQQNINTQFQQVGTQLKEIRFDRLRDQFTMLDSHMQELGHNSQLTSSAHLRMANLDLQKDLNRRAAFFMGELKHMLDTKQLDERMFCELLRAFNLSVSAQMESLLSIDEKAAAYKAIESHTSELDSLLNDLDPVSFTEMKLINQSENNDDIETYASSLKQSQELVKSFRNTQQMSKSKLLLLETLDHQEITGSQYLREIKADSDQVLRMLPV